MRIRDDGLTGKCLLFFSLTFLRGQIEKGEAELQDECMM